MTEPIYFIKHSELLNLVGMDKSWDRADISTEIICRGDLTKMWDSHAIIGKCQKVFDIRKENDPYKNQLKDHELQWRSFYNGWGEGRISMLSEIYAQIGVIDNGRRDNSE